MVTVCRNSLVRNQHRGELNQVDSAFVALPRVPLNVPASRAFHPQSIVTPLTECVDFTDTRGALWTLHSSILSPSHMGDAA